MSRHSLPVVVACTVGTLMTQACGGLSHQVDRDLLHAVSVENKLSLFDAENHVSITLDEREQIRREIQNLRRDVSDAEKRIADAVEDEERAAQKGDAQRRQVAVLAQKVFAKEVEYLEERIALMRTKLNVQDALIYVAFAQYELAKAKLVKKNNINGAQDIAVVDFEEQVAEAVERAKGQQADFSAEETEVEKLRESWMAQRQELSRASGGGLGTAWAEESSLWGN